MVKGIREEYNRKFTQEAYQALLARMEQDYPNQLEFRISETPAFMDRALKHKLIAAGEYVIDMISRPGFKAMTDGALPQGLQVPGESDHTEYLVLDYAICADETGHLVPRMIELQGFPSLYGFQQYFSQLLPEYLYVPENYSYFFDDMTGDQYIDLLRRTICGTYAPEDCILLEIEPERQKTRVDFVTTKTLTGVDAVCLTKLHVRDNKVYRTMPDGAERQVRRIYNRVIFDELLALPDLKTEFDFSQPYEIEWSGHPAWFFRISKYVLPMLDHPSVPKTRRLAEFRPEASELSKYVLKPLFSFAGQGVVFDVKPEDLDAVADPENWILMEKVQYAPAIHAPEADIKCEIRLLYLWPKGDPRPTLCTNLIRLSQGTMMGVRFNKDKTWVGGNTAYLERG